MRPIHRILVAIKDPAARRLPAVQKAARLASALGAELELFHGISTPLYLDAYAYQQSLPEMESEIRSGHLQRLERIATRLRKANLKVTVAAEWDFPVYEAIVRRARRIQADLIVAEAHGHRHIAPSLLHLTDWELLRCSSVPVLLVKQARAYRRPAVLAAVDPSHACAKPADLDDEILQAATTMSATLNGTLHAVHAYTPLPASTVWQEITSDVTRATTQAKADASRRFNRVLREAQIGPKCRHLVGLHPYNAILDTAKSTNSAIVVMGALSRSGLKRLIFGNTAESLLDALPCDLLIVKSSRFASKVQKAGRGVRFVAPAAGVYG